VDKSILLAEEHPPGSASGCSTPSASTASDLLRATGEERLLRLRHRDFYLGVARRFDDQWCGPEQVIWYQRLTREHANLRAALEFSLAAPAEHAAALELVAALLFFWVACGHPREGPALPRAGAGAGASAGPTLAKAWWVCGWICAMQGDNAAAERRCREPAVRGHPGVGLDRVPVRHDRPVSAATRSGRSRSPTSPQACTGRATRPASA
jgi:non-specific serine/threonine protein kinase